MPNELTGWLAVVLIVGLLSAILLTGNRAQTLGHAVVTFADDRIAGFGLNLQNVRLVNVSDAAAPDIKRALNLTRGQPIALMDLSEVQKSIENVGWVKSATVRRQFPGLLVVSVVERPRLAVWQYQGKDVVIDDQGQIIPEAHAVNFINLPLVVGEGANEQAADILELLNARPALLQRTYALVRVDTRRWDIHLKNGAIIKLPALNQDQALARLDALIAQRRVLDQGFAEIDLLDPEALQVIPLQSHTASAQ
jgi:cell division protein FtsQ